MRSVLRTLVAAHPAERERDPMQERLALLPVTGGAPPRASCDHLDQIEISGLRACDAPPEGEPEAPVTRCIVAVSGPSSPPETYAMAQRSGYKFLDENAYAGAISGGRIVRFERGGR